MGLRNNAEVVSGKVTQLLELSKVWATVYADFVITLC